MRIADFFEETYLAISVNKARSSLTILGIVIGIGSVITMIAVGRGAQSSIEANIQSIGSNLLLVMPGSQRGAGLQVSAGRGSAQTLTMTDVEAITNDISTVSNVAPEISRRYQITAKGKNTNTQVVGSVPSYITVRNVQMASGNFLADAQVNSAAKVAVLGPTTKEDLFGADGDPIGQTIRINRIEFKIIGVSKSKGGTGFGNQDDVIYVPLTTAQKFLAGDNYVSTISVQVTDQALMTTTQQEITNLLLQRHNISNPQMADFSVLNQSDIVAAATSVTGIFTMLLASIAGISLLVGGIGIMNMMLTTVTERTREIGLRKAIGGKASDISTQFLIESVMLTFLGGIFGIMLGWLLALGVTKFAGITTEISWQSIGLAFGVSAGIGVIFGYYPARRASKLNPIEALRYE